jgi:hypothetical protein
MGWRVVNDGMQIMGGESYMTENEVERVFRDSRINIIVEGANEVMQSFIFAYGGKQLAEKMLTVKNAVGWNNDEGAGSNIVRILKNGANLKVMRAAIPLGMEIFLGIRRQLPPVPVVHDSLRTQAERLAWLIREHSHQFKRASKRYEERIITRQCVQARLADNAMWLHAFACTLSKLDQDLRRGGDGTEFERDKAAALHFFDIAETSFYVNIRELSENADESMLKAAAAAIKHSDSQPNSEFAIPESSPVARGTGRPLKQDGIKQFPGTPTVGARAH